MDETTAVRQAPVPDEAAAGRGRGSSWRHLLLRAFGIRPPIGVLVAGALDEALAAAERSSPGSVTVLDAGCGRKSPLAAFRPRIARLVGVDQHEPDPPLPYLDAFATVDLCREPDAFPPAAFDVVLSHFTLEHFPDPAAALAAMHGWLRPGGTFVATTVNRRHPFVLAYLSIPGGLRSQVQPLVKASRADAHPLVGACNDPAAVRAALELAGFEDVRIELVGHLARSWGRHAWSFALGLVGDAIVQPVKSRRSTILVTARRPVRPSAA